MIYRHGGQERQLVTSCIKYLAVSGLSSVVVHFNFSCSLTVNCPHIPLHNAPRGIFPLMLVTNTIDKEVEKLVLGR